MRNIVRSTILVLVLALSVVAVSPVAAAGLPAQPSQSAQPPYQTQSAVLGVHTVLQGETLDCIGRAYSVDPNAIAQANGTSSPVPGQQLQIPAVPWYNMPAGGTACPAQFQVPAGWPQAAAAAAPPAAAAVAPPAAAAAAPPAATAAQPGIWPSPYGYILGYHVVQPYEWIYCIARAYRVDPVAIAQASRIPGPYGPAGWCGWCGGWHGSCGGCGGWQPAPCGWGWCGASPWNYVYPGQVLTIPAVRWYNMPPGPTCRPQPTVRLPPGW